MRSIPLACGPVSQPWCSCSSACLSSCSRASARGKKRNQALAGTVTRPVLIVGWGMMGTLLRRLRGGLGGIGGFDDGEGLVLYRNVS